MSTLSAAQIAEAARNGGFLLNSECTVAIAVALAESGGVTTATHQNTNGSTDYGLWQINSIHASILRSGSWSNPTDNARMARQVYEDAGGKWTPWSTYNSGRYLAFMSVARRAAYGGTGSVPLPSGGSSVQGSATPNAVQSGFHLPVPSVISSPLAGFVGLAKFLTSGSTYVRAGMLLAGILLLWWGLRSLTELDNKAAAGVVKAGLAVATDGASLTGKAMK